MLAVGDAVILGSSNHSGWRGGHYIGNTRAYPCYREGQPTNSGREMAQFLGNRGANLGVTLRRIAGRPSGRRC